MQEREALKSFNIIEGRGGGGGGVPKNMGAIE